MEVRRMLKFCAAHRLLGYNGACSRLHGHNYRVEVTIAGESLNDLEMLVDFRDIKRKLQGWLDANWDHRTILNKADPLARMLDKAVPGDAVVLGKNPTAEHMADVLLDVFSKTMSRVASVAVWETDDSCAIQHK